MGIMVGIGARVEVITATFLGRWVEPSEQGEVVGTHISPAEQDVYDVQLDKDGKVYTFATAEIEEIRPAP